MHSIAKCTVRRTPLWLHLWFYIIQGFTNAQWKSSVSMAKCGMNLFWLSSIILHWWKALWTMRAFVNCAMVLTKRLNFLIQVLNEYSPQPSKLLYNCQLKTRRRSKTLKGSQRMGGGRIFLKSFRASLFNEDLSNEPNFSRIHFTGQYL